MALINLCQRHFMNNESSTPFERADVIFVVDNHEIPGHRLILGHACPYFEKLLCGDFMESKSKRVQITGTSAKVFTEVIRFIYSGQLEIVDWKNDDLLELYSSAHEYQLEQLMAAVTKALGEQSMDFNSWELVKSAASLYESDALKAKCLSFVETKVHDFLNCKDLEQFTAELIHSIMDLPKVVNCNQDDLLYAICQWSNHHSSAGISTMLSKINWTKVSRAIKSLILKDVFSTAMKEEDFTFKTKLAEMKKLQSEGIARVLSVHLLKNSDLEFALEKYQYSLKVHFGVLVRDCGISILFRKRRVFRVEIPVKRIEFQSSTHFIINRFQGCNLHLEISKMVLSVSKSSNQCFKYSGTFFDATPVCEIQIILENYGQLTNIKLENLVVS